MGLYCGIDLHSNNHVMTVIDEGDRRMKQCKLELHPEKSGIVYCRDKNRTQEYPRIQFTFLGYTFRPRRALDRNRKAWTDFLPAVSAAAIKRMNLHIREWRIHGQTSVGLHELARHYNPKLRGWMNYYGRFCRSAVRRVFPHFELRLVKWARRKYRHLGRYPRLARRWLARMVRRYPRLFSHWLTSGRVSVRTMGAV